MYVVVGLFALTWSLVAALNQRIDAKKRWLMVPVTLGLGLWVCLDSALGGEASGYEPVQTIGFALGLVIAGVGAFFMQTVVVGGSARTERLAQCGTRYLLGVGAGLILLGSALTLA